MRRVCRLVRGKRTFGVMAVAMSIMTVLPMTTVKAEGDRTEDKSFVSSWECEETALIFEVEEAVLDPHVPDEFTMITKSGRVQLGVFANDCTVSVDGGPASRIVLSGVIVEIENPDGSPGDGFSYDIHWGTNSPDYYKAMHRLGFGSFTPSSTYTNTPSPAVIADIEADVDWKESPYSFTARVIETNPTRLPFTSVHWAPAKKGYTRSTYPHNIMVSLGEGELHIQKGTLLYDILRTERATAPALFGRFTIEDAITEEASP